MSPELFRQRLAAICAESLPLPGAGETPQRHRCLMQVGREDLSLAKLAEAHWDAIAILSEAGRTPVPGALYGVWASEIPGRALRLERAGTDYRISGTKMFCSGAGVIDCVLMTAGSPESHLVEVDLNSNRERVLIDASGWNTDAFQLTCTSTVTFREVGLAHDAVLGEGGWYVNRPGFWHGACGPAACWAGGVAGLLDFALLSNRSDPHTVAHLGAMHANVWALEAFLDAAGREIDNDSTDRVAAQIRALQVRHLVEQACTDTLQRFARAYGPAPLSMHGEVARRYHEADLYLRQSHAERDLESLARVLKEHLL